MSVQQGNQALRSLFAIAAGNLTVALLDHVRGILENKPLCRKIALILLLFSVSVGSLSIAQIDPMGNTTGTISAAGTDPSVQVVLPKSIASPELINALADSIDQGIASLKANSKIAGIGKIFIGMGLAGMMLWSSIKIMASGKGVTEMFADWVPLFVAYAIVNALLEPGAHRLIVDFMNGIAASIAGHSMSTTKDVIGSGALQLIKALVTVMQMPTISDPGLGDVLTGKIVLILVDLIVVWLYKLICGLFIVIAACIFMATAVMSQISIELVLALAPLMVPFLIFKPMDWLFNSWLKFLLSASMMKIVGAFMLAATSAMMGSIGKVTTAIAADSGAGITLNTVTNDFLLYSFVLLIVVMMALLMLQVPSISNGIMAGHASGSGFSGASAVNMAMGSKAANAFLPSAGATVHAIGPTGRFSARMAGGRDAAAGMPSAAGKYKSGVQARAYQAAYLQAKAASKSPPGNPPPGGGGGGATKAGAGNP